MPQSALSTVAAPLQLTPLLSTTLFSGGLLGTLTLAFPSLLQDPPSALLTSLAPLTLLQGTYLLTLPSPLPARKKPYPRPHLIKSSIKSLILSYALAMTLGTAVLTALAILMGAPITTHLPHTTLFAAHLSVLTLWPLTFELGVDSAAWRKVMEARVVGNGREFCAAMGGVVGSWLGAVVIPLDWDRVWQRWPVPILVGGYLGVVVGRAVGASGLVKASGKGPKAE